MSQETQAGLFGIGFIVGFVGVPALSTLNVTGLATAGANIAGTALSSGSAVANGVASQAAMGPTGVTPHAGQELNKLDTPMQHGPGASSSLAKEPGAKPVGYDESMEYFQHGRVAILPVEAMIEGAQAAWRFFFPARTFASLEVAVGNQARAKVVQAVVRGDESLGALTTAERDAAAQFYRQTADKVGGNFAEAARGLNIDRARYLEGSLKEAPGRLFEWMAKNGYDVL